MIGRTPSAFLLTSRLVFDKALFDEIKDAMDEKTARAA